MTCSRFRTAFVPGTEDQASLEHIRSCDACLDYAAHVDPEVMFRALGGAELLPPGGVDAFVADVMHTIQLHDRVGQLDVRTAPSWTRKLAIAAALTAAISGGTLLYQTERTGRGRAVTHTAAALPHPAAHAPLTTKPVVESYSSANATIVEVPNSGSSDVQVVMIFDDTLPADL